MCHSSEQIYWDVSRNGSASHGLGGTTPKMSLSPPPHCETYWSRIRGWFVPKSSNFDRFCSQKSVNLQTASASANLLPRLCSWTPVGASVPHAHRAIAPKWKFLALPPFSGNVVQDLAAVWTGSLAMTRRISGHCLLWLWPVTFVYHQLIHFAGPSNV